MSEKKPKRVKDDPEGYEPVFDLEKWGTNCEICAVRYTDACRCPTYTAPCHSQDRPEGRPIHYVKKGDKAVQKKPSDKPAKPAEKSGIKTIGAGVFDIKTLVGGVLVIEAFSNDGRFQAKEAEVRGVFKNVEAALDHIRDDTEDVYGGDKGNSITDLENWGADCLIVEVKRVVRPVPVVSVKAEIKTIAGG